MTPYDDVDLATLLLGRRLVAPEQLEAATRGLSPNAPPGSLARALAEAGAVERRVLRATIEELQRSVVPCPRCRNPFVALQAPEVRRVVCPGCGKRCRLAADPQAPPRAPDWRTAAQTHALPGTARQSRRLEAGDPEPAPRPAPAPAPDATWQDPGSQGRRATGVTSKKATGPSEVTWRDRGRAARGLLPDLGPGDVVGPYLIEKEISRGAMGIVFRGRHRELKDRVVALKVMHAELEADSESLRRFQREAEALARLDHEHVVRVHDAATLGDGRPYLAMELLAGKTLEQVLAKRGALGVEAAAGLVAAVSEGVAHMHARGIVHRDLKLANVIVGPDGTPKVADFGIAFVRDSSTRLTVDGDMLGTPVYMAPEAILSGKDAGPPVDVYALGVMLFRLLTAAYPFHAPTIPELYRLVLEAPLEVPADLPPDARAVLGKALARSTRERYPDAGALAADLRALAAGEPVGARPYTRWERLRRRVRRRPGRFAAAGALGLAAAVAAGGLVVVALGGPDGDGRQPSPPPPPTAPLAERLDLAEADLVAGRAEAARDRLRGVELPEPEPGDAARWRASLGGRARWLLAWAELAAGDPAAARAALETAPPAVRAELAVAAAEAAGPAERAEAIAAAAERLAACGEGEAARARLGLDLLQARRAGAVEPALAAAGEALAAETPRALLAAGAAYAALGWREEAAWAYGRAEAALADAEPLPPRPVRTAGGEVRFLAPTEAARRAATRTRGWLLDPGAPLAEDVAPDPAEAARYRADGRAELAAARAAGDARVRDRHTERAERAFRLATRLDPGSPAAWAGLAEVLLARGDVVAAAHEVERAEEAAGGGDPPAAVRLARGLVRAAREQGPEAGRDLLAAAEAIAAAEPRRLARAARLDRTLERSFTALAEVGATRQALTVAERHSAQADALGLPIERRQRLHDRLLGLAADRAGAEDAAAAARDRREALRADVARYNELSQAYVAARGRGPRAGRAVALELVALEPSRAETYYLRVTVTDRIGARELLDPTLFEAFAIAGELRPYLVCAYMTEERRRRERDAAPTADGNVRRILAEAPDDPALPRRRSDAFRTALAAVYALELGVAPRPDELAAAREAAERFRAARPCEPAAALVLGRLLLESGRPARAREVLRLGAELPPPFLERPSELDAAPFLLLAAMASADLGDWTAAARLLRRLAQESTRWSAGSSPNLARGFATRLRAEPRFQRDTGLLDDEVAAVADELAPR